MAGKPKDEEPQETSLIPPSDRAMPWCAGRLAAPLARHHTAKSFRSLSYAMRVAWAFSASRRPWWRRSQRRLAARCEHVEGDQVGHGGSGLSVASLAPPLGARSSTRLAARISHWPASSVSSRSIAVVSYGCWRRCDNTASQSLPNISASSAVRISRPASRPRAARSIPSSISSARALAATASHTSSSSILRQDHPIRVGELIRVLPLMPDLHIGKGDLKRRGTACAIEGVTFGRLSRCACRRVPLRPLTQWVRPFAGSGQFDYEAHRCSAHGTQLLNSCCAHDANRVFTDLKLSRPKPAEPEPISLM